jgi:hypothetical protein
MTQTTNNPMPKLGKASQPPLSYTGAAADSDRAKEPRLAEPPANDQDLKRGDRGRGFGQLRKPTGEFGTVEHASEGDTVVDSSTEKMAAFKTPPRLHQPWLKKVWPANKTGPIPKFQRLHTGAITEHPVQTAARRLLMSADS